MVVVIMRQGPHHSAQKSTSTGTSEFSTSLSQPASVNVKVLAPAISFLSQPSLNRCKNRRKRFNCQQLAVEGHIFPSRRAPGEILLHTAPHHGNPFIPIPICGYSQANGLEQRASGILPELKTAILVNGIIQPTR